MIVVVGNTAEDVYLRVDAFAAPGESRLAEPAGRALGGKGANQALAAARAGAEVLFVTAVGIDDAGQRLAAILQRAPFAEVRVHRTAAATDVSFVQLGPRGQNVVVSTHACARALGARHLRRLPLAPGATLLLQANLDLGVTADLMRRARAAGARVAFNPSPSVQGLAELLELADLVVLNEREAIDLGGVPDATAAGLRLARDGRREVVVTLGERGARWLRRGGAIEAAAPAVEATDTTGAGDVLCGVLLAELDRGAAPETALRAAVTAASHAATHLGAHPSVPPAEEAAAC